MRKTYTFMTSLGQAEIVFDPCDFKPHDVLTKGCSKKTLDCVSDIQWVKGRELINELYWSYDPMVVRGNEGTLWLRVELVDPHFGIPEYLLEEKPL